MIEYTDTQIHTAAHVKAFHVILGLIILSSKVRSRGLVPCEFYSCYYIIFLYWLNQVEFITFGVHVVWYILAPHCSHGGDACLIFSVVVCTWYMLSLSPCLFVSCRYDHLRKCFNQGWSAPRSEHELSGKGYS